MIEKSNENSTESTQKWKGCQGDNPDIHWRRWRQSSTCPVNTKAANLPAFLFLCRSANYQNNYVTALVVVK